jgi:hypothetical protein
MQRFIEFISRCPLRYAPDYPQVHNFGDKFLKFSSTNPFAWNAGTGYSLSPDIHIAFAALIKCVNGYQLMRSGV